MNQKIIDIAKIVFALIFVVLLAVMMGTISSKGNSANTKLVDTLEMSDGLDMETYNGVDMKGSTVANALRNGQSLGGGAKLFFYVETGEGNTSIYGYGSDSGSDALSGLTYVDGDEAFSETVYPSNTFTSYSASNNDADYINTTAEFHSRLIQNANGVIVGIEFTQN